MGYLRLTRDGVTLAEIQVVREQANVLNASTPAQLSAAYNQAQDGWTIQLAPGFYGEWDSPSGATKRVTIKGAPNFGSVFKNIDARASNTTFDGVDINGQTQQLAGYYNPGQNNTLKNSRIHNILNEKGSYCSGPNATFDNCDIYDIWINNSDVHSEGIYSLSPNLTVRNCRFNNCANMDVFITRGSWYNQPVYGGVSLIDNYFGVSRMPVHMPGQQGSAHYYGLGINGGVIQEQRDWTVRGNHFEQPVGGSAPVTGTGVYCGNTGQCSAAWKVACV